MTHKNEKWYTSHWRPALAWLYFAVNIFDFIIFPILWAIIQTFTHQPLTVWDPLTLKGAGLFHISFAAILGISAHGRTLEKISIQNNSTTPE